MPSQTKREYDDAYPTCFETYSTLRVFSDAVSPEEITMALQIEPTRAFHKGDVHSQGKLRRKAHGWFFSTEGHSDSRDTRRHIDIILSALDGRQDSLKELRSKDCAIDITSYYVSTGQGGPCLWPHQMSKLGEFDIPVWWDVYFKREGKVRSAET